HPIESLVSSFRRMADDADPRTAERGATAAREEAEGVVLASLHGRERRKARRVLAKGRRIIPLRVVAKAAFTQTFDVARIAARVVGARLVSEGRLDHADDVFYLSLAELDAVPDDLPSIVAESRTHGDASHELEL